MNIAFLAHDKKKELMVQFCTAYKSILSKHTLFATATTGRLIADNTGLPITMLLSHKQGGHQQINARIAYYQLAEMAICLGNSSVSKVRGLVLFESDNSYIRKNKRIILIV